MRVIRSRGTPFERGRAVGRELAEEIWRSAAFTMSWAADLGADRSRIEQLLAAYDHAGSAVVSDLMELLDGMAVGSGVDPVALRATNAFEELYVVLDPEALGAPVERCTDVLLAGPEGPLLVHQEQWYVANADSVAIVIDEPDDGIAVISPVVASGVPLVGMNATGAGLGAMSLTAADGRAGVPRMFVARRALEARDPAEAWRTVTMPERAGGYTWCYAFAGGATAIFETTATTAADLRDESAHANHALDHAVAAVCPAGSEGSRSRLARMRSLTSDRDVWTVPEASALLGDHGADGQNICVHPDPADGPEASAIMFGMIADVANRTLWVAPGNPCENAFEPYSLDELLPERERETT
jgi:Acyl-coenzyme A:6-aminopenicillanic acid acyl-transferase